MNTAPAVTLTRTREQIKAEIEEIFGFVPPFFEAAEQTPQALENLWQQTLLAYVNNPLPSLFKEKLSAYLSRFCSVPYCMICHSCSLRSLGVEAPEVLKLLETPAPTATDIDEHLSRLTKLAVEIGDLPGKATSLLGSNAALEESLLYCSIFIFLSSEQAQYCRVELRHLLGLELYQHLVSFIAYVKTCHIWMEAHAEVSYEADERAIAHFDALVQEEPGLATFFSNYREKVGRERQTWQEQMAEIQERKRHEEALRRAAAENLRLARAVASASEGVLITDPNQPHNPIIYSNPAFTKITGYSADEVMGRNCRFLQGAGTDRQAIARIRQAIAQRREVKATLLNYRKDGQPFWNELKISPVFSDKGELLYFVGIQTDITERKWAEEALRKSENHLRAIIEAEPECVKLVAADGTLLEINAAGLAMIEADSTEAAIGQSVYFFIAPEYREAFQSLNERVFQGEKATLEFEIIGCKGTRRWMETHAVPLLNEAEGTLVHLGITRDITERKRSEQERLQLLEREQAAKNQAIYILESITDAFYALDREWHFTYLNSQAERLLQRTHDKLMGKNIWAEFPEAVSSIFWEQYHKAVSQRVAVEFEAFYEPLNGWFEVHAYPSKEGLAVYFRDISQRKQAEAEMHRTQAFLNSIVENIPHMIFVKDAKDLKFAIFNKTGAELVGFPKEELIGKSDRDFFPPEVADFFNTKDREVLAGRNLLDIPEEPIQTKEKGLRILHTKKIPIFDTDGKPQYLLGISEDITERKQAEEALRQSEERFRNLVETTSDWVWEVDENAIYTYSSPKVRDLLGYEPEAIIGQTLFDLMPPEQAFRVANIFGPIAAKQEPFTCLENANLHQQGHPVVLETSGVPIFDSEGQLRGYRGISRDISERKLAEDQIREQATLLDKSQDAIIVLDREQKIRFWNKSARRLYGWTSDEVMGCFLHDLLFQEIISQAIPAQQIVFEKGEWHGELHQVTKNGKKIIVESRWTLVRDRQEQPKSILIINTDITEKKQLEAQFHRAQRMESIGTLAGGIAHDLNNVLTPILAAVQILQMVIPDDRSQRMLSLLESNAKRGADLIKQVLSFARGLEGERAMLQVGHLIDEIEKIAKETFPKSINICTNIPTIDLWPISGDATQLHQVLMNLCVNARDAMPEGGNLCISAENILIDENYARMNIDAKVGPYVMLNISDTGCGIPIEIQERIFEPFFTTKEIGKGTGLGLSTVMGIIKGHGGFINVYSEVGKGTQFNVYLPAIKITETEPNKTEQKIPCGNGELLLVVDDETSICEVTKTSLEVYNYRVLTANDGIEAIAVYAQHKLEIRAIVMDMMMPSMDGLTAIRTLEKINPQVKIIATSGLVSNIRSAEVAGSCVKTFLPKPFTAEQLLKTLHQVMGRGES